MHVGTAVVFQNPGRMRPDHEVYRQELRLADLVEPLGYDSIWGVEHHFTDYTMCPDVLQFLSYMAGRTERINLGSMVVVLPWHDPLRVAEQVAMLDAMSGGRLILGLGRGAAKVEFDGFRLPMEESRPRFVESAAMVLRGLESGFCEQTGDFVTQPRVRIRPAPFKSFRGRTYAAAVSPESARIMAELGVGILIIPQKPWHEVAKELDAYRTMYREVNAAEAPAPIAAGWTFCDEGRPRRGDGPPVHRRLLPVGARALPVRRRSSRQDARLRVLRQDDREDRAVRDRQGHRLLPGAPGVGHTRAVLRADPGHPRAREQSGVRGRLLLRRDAVRRGRAQHAAVRARGDPGTEEAG